MQKFYAFALCAAFACILAVIFLLLHANWKDSNPDGSGGAAKPVPQEVRPENDSE